MTTAKDIIDSLQLFEEPERVEKNLRFLQVFPGGYGYGDKVLGISVPNQRRVVKEAYRTTSLAELSKLIQSEYHEHRLTALFIAVKKFETSKKNPVAQADIVKWYTKHLAFVNNWDLVDSSCYKILGPWLLGKDRSLLYQYAQSENIWENRIAMVTQKAFIKVKDFSNLFEIAEILYSHSEEIVQKSVGWMLKEAAEHIPERVIDFVNKRPEPKLIRRIAFEKLST